MNRCESFGLFSDANVYSHLYSVLFGESSVCWIWLSVYFSARNVKYETSTRSTSANLCGYEAGERGEVRVSAAGGARWRVFRSFE